MDKLLLISIIYNHPFIISVSVFLYISLAIFNVAIGVEIENPDLYILIIY